MQKTGFIYIWHDTKRNMFYIGCHYGTEDDGYICSSNRMRDAFRRRPNDFKRRVLKRNIDRKVLLEEEYKWLQLIPNEQLGKRYYNISKKHFGHWSTDSNRNKTIGQKISEATTGKSRNKGKIPSEETRKKISDALKGKPLGYIRTEETRKKISENNKKAQAERRIGMHGKKHTEETIQKMKINNAMNNPEHRLKISQAKKGIKWLSNDIDKKMAVPGTDKFFNLINEGYRVI